MKFSELVYLHGFYAGVGLIMLPIVTDLLWFGGREFNAVSIGNVGVIIQCAGIALMLFGGRNAR